MNNTVTLQEKVRKAAEGFKQWKFGRAFLRGQVPVMDHRSQPLMPRRASENHSDNNYFLSNKKTGKFLQYESQTWGINLGWTDDNEAKTAAQVSKWFFTNKDGSGPVRYGDLVALGWTENDKPYVRYGHRNVGINLDWSDSPEFEWKILGGKNNEPVQLGDQVAIFNIKSEGGEVFIYFDRTLGGDIGWPSSETFFEQFKDAAKDLIEEVGAKRAKELVLEYLKNL